MRLTEAEKTIENQGIENVRLQASIRKLEAEKRFLEQKLSESEQWLKPTFMLMSSSARTDMKEALVMAKESFPPGTNDMLRRTIGLNISKKLVPITPKEKRLQEAVKTFAIENSSEVPDERKARKGIRYYHHYKYVLHEHFLSSTDILCSYQTFCSYWPPHIIKPKIGDYSRCCCVHCENPSLLYDALVSSKHLPSDLPLDILVTASLTGNQDRVDDFLEMTSELIQGEKKKDIISYLSWEKVPQLAGRSGQQREAVERIKKISTVGEAAQRMEISFEALRDHLGRNRELKNAIKEMRNDSLETDGHALIHMDWAENLVVEVSIFFIIIA